jgi:hypothetical protein
MEPRHMLWRAWAIACAIGAASCSSESGGGAAATFPMTVTTDSGALRVVITATPNPPVVGTNEFDFVVTRTSDGSAVDGVSLAVQPFMPAMDHGTSVPMVTPLGGGRYRVENVYTFMPGLWELETTVSGSVSDHASPEFQVR